MTQKIQVGGDWDYSNAMPLAAREIYRVIFHERTTRTYLVDAESPGQARRRVIGGRQNGAKVIGVETKDVQRSAAVVVE